ncbi:MULTISPECIES: helix-turn-helix domain-containing protein [unclassified Sulfitobacter]
MLQAIEDGRSYRWIARDLGISKNTVSDIIKRNRQKGL